MVTAEKRAKASRIVLPFSGGRVPGVHRRDPDRAHDLHPRGAPGHAEDRDHSLRPPRGTRVHVKDSADAKVRPNVIRDKHVLAIFRARTIDIRILVFCQLAAE